MRNLTVLLKTLGIMSYGSDVMLGCATAAFLGANGLPRLAKSCNHGATLMCPSLQGHRRHPPPDQRPRAPAGA